MTIQRSKRDELPFGDEIGDDPFVEPDPLPVADEFENQNQGETDSGWVPAPAESHVLDFRLLDRSASAYGAGSQLQIRFKANFGKSHAPQTEYHYAFPDHSQGRAVFDALCGAGEPGKVVWTELIRKNVPYDGPM